MPDGAAIRAPRPGHRGAAAVEWVGVAGVAGLVVLVLLGAAGPAAARLGGTVDAVACALARTADPGSGEGCRPAAAPAASVPRAAAPSPLERRDAPTDLTARTRSSSGATPPEPKACTRPVEYGSATPGARGRLCLPGNGLVQFCGVGCDAGIPTSFLPECSPSLTGPEPLGQVCAIELEDGRDALLACAPADERGGAARRDRLACREDAPGDAAPASVDGCDRPLATTRRGDPGTTVLTWACPNPAGELFHCSREVATGTLLPGRLEPLPAECGSRTFPDAGVLHCEPTSEEDRTWRCDRPGTREAMLCTVLGSGGPDVAAKPLHCRAPASLPAVSGADRPVRRVECPADRPRRTLKAGATTLGQLDLCELMQAAGGFGPGNPVADATVPSLGFPSVPRPSGARQLARVAAGQWAAARRTLPPAWGIAAMPMPIVAVDADLPRGAFDLASVDGAPAVLLPETAGDSLVATALAEQVLETLGVRLTGPTPAASRDLHATVRALIMLSLGPQAHAAAVAHLQRQLNLPPGSTADTTTLRALLVAQGLADGRMVGTVGAAPRATPALLARVLPAVGGGGPVASGDLLAALDAALEPGPARAEFRRRFGERLPAGAAAERDPGEL